MAAKYGKQIAIGVAILLMLFAIWLAVKSYENLQQDLVESEMARGAQIVAHETTLASLEVQEEATAQWKASAVKYQNTLKAQEKARVAAREESRRIDESLRTHNLEKLARAKPELIERIVNRATHRIIGLLNCASTSSGCKGTDRTTGSDTSDPVPSAFGSGELRLDSNGPWALARS